jgi:large subunit ribosomal protein L14e
MVFNVGRICMKLAGRDAGKYCVIVNEIDTNFVEIDGQTRRRKCNIDHLEPLDKTADIKAGADNKAVAKALTDAGFDTDERVKKEAKPKAAKKAPVTKKAAAKKETKAE